MSSKMQYMICVLVVACIVTVGCRASAATLPPAPESPAATSDPTVLPTVAPMPTVTPPAVPPTMAPLPTREADYGPWQLVRDVRVKSSTFAAAFLDESFGITAGYMGEVHYTMDGAHTWPRADNNTLCRHGIEIVSEQVAWHCGNGGSVRVSTDGGRTWMVAGSYGPGTPNQCRFLSFLDAKTGWAATPRKLGATTDGGVTWTDVTLPEQLAEIAAISLLNATHGYLLDAAGMLYTTYDAGARWEVRSIGLPTGQRISTGSMATAAMRFLNDKEGVIVYQVRPQMWTARTLDGGETWQHDVMPAASAIGAVYLTRDATVLTLFDGAKVTLLRAR